MEKENLSEYLDFGKVQLNVLSFEKTSKDEFLKKYKGKIPVDVDHVWFKIQERLRKLGKTENEKYKTLEEVKPEEQKQDVSEPKSTNRSKRKAKGKTPDAVSEE